MYIITLSAGADFSCPDYATAEVEIQFLLNPNSWPPHRTVSKTTTSAWKVWSVDENTVYEWDFGGEVAFADVNGEVVNGLIYAEPGTYEVSLTASALRADGMLGDVQRPGDRHR